LNLLLRLQRRRTPRPALGKVEPLNP
jgi:hypothetical protein